MDYKFYSILPKIVIYWPLIVNNDEDETIAEGYTVGGYL